MGRPLLGGACQATSTVPRVVGEVPALSPSGASGGANGMIVLLSGDSAEAALRSLTAATVKAYCMP